MVAGATAMAASIPACVTGSYASYEALTGGCVIDNLLFSNFSDLESSTSAGMTLAATAIMVTPTLVSLDEGLTFSALWSVATPNGLDSVLLFSVQTVNGATTLDDLGLAFKGAVAGNGASGVTETYCVGSVLGTAHCPSSIQTIALGNPSSGSSGPLTKSFTATDALSIAKDISVSSGIASGGAASTASITMVSNTYSQMGVVAEPMPFLLLGSGLLGIALMRRRTMR